MNEVKFLFGYMWQIVSVCSEPGRLFVLEANRPKNDRNMIVSCDSLEQENLASFGIIDYSYNLTQMQWGASDLAIMASRLSSDDYLTPSIIQPHIAFSS